MLGRFGTGWVCFETNGCCPDFGVFARARLLSLEQALCFSSFARARVPSLEHASASRLDLKVGNLRSSEPYVSCFFARARTLALERASGLQT